MVGTPEQRCAHDPTVIHINKFLTLLSGTAHSWTIVGVEAVRKTWRPIAAQILIVLTGNLRDRARD
jgi:hypothetical protein